MKITQAKQPDGTIRIKAKASAKDVDNILNITYNEIAKIFGIEPDPEKTFEQAVFEKTGTSDLDPMVVPRALERLVPMAIDASGLRPAFLPTGKPTSTLRLGREFTYEFVLTPKPKMELSSYDPVSIVAVEPVIFEEDVEQEIAKYQETIKQFDDPEKDAKLRELVLQKLEFQRQKTYEAELRQLVSIELAKRLEGEIPDEILRHMHSELKTSLQAQLAEQGKPYEEWLEEHDGEQNVEMMLMWQAREALRQGYALDAYFRAKKLKITETDLNLAFENMSGIAQADAARKMAREMGRMFTVYETAERFKATDHALEQATIEVRTQTPLERVEESE